MKLNCIQNLPLTTADLLKYELFQEKNRVPVAISTQTTYYPDNTNSVGRWAICYRKVAGKERTWN